MTESASADSRANAGAEAMMAFVLRLRSHGLTDQKILNAVSTLPRPLFVQPEHAGLAWGDLSLPLPCGQTITPPLLVAVIAEHLDVMPQHRVLEVGTGSGYLTAVLARLAQRVMTIDRWRTLISEAEERLRAVAILNVTMMVADGHLGWRHQAPFDRIVVTASAPEVPPALIEQLAEGGRLIMPLGQPGAEQHLTLIEKQGETLRHTTLQVTRVPPLTAGVAGLL